MLVEYLCMECGLLVKVKPPQLKCSFESFYTKAFVMCLHVVSDCKLLHFESKFS